MLNLVEVYSSSQLAEAITFDEDGLVENDFIQVINIDGIDPVTASIDVITSGNVDGAISSDAQVPTRNIVLTLRPNPEWSTWTYETIRKFIYSYFIPKNTVKLIFDSDEIGALVEIIGTIESCAANPFTKDPQYNVSIICPDPYFVAVEATVVTGTIIDPSNWSADKTTVAYAGNVPIGVNVKLEDGFSSEVYIQAGETSDSTFHMIDTISEIMAMCSIPLHKFVREVSTSDGSFTNKLSKLQLGSQWPILFPGDNSFAVMGPSVGNAWELSYYEKYGGL